MSIDLTQITGAAFLQMDREEQYRVLTEVYREQFFEDVKQSSVQAIDVLEAVGVNDYAQGHSRIEIVLGYLNACSAVMRQAFETQHRHELQCMDKDTQFGAQLAESMYDLSAEIRKQIDNLITVQTYYAAVLGHRRDNNVNLLDAEGNVSPYKPEVLERERLLQEEHEQQWKQRLRAERAELERVYWGQQEPAPLPEGHDSAQLPLPLWTAGFAVV